MRDVTAATAAHMPITLGFQLRKWCSVYQIESSPTCSASFACSMSLA
jgi:hypothetical protein